VGLSSIHSRPANSLSFSFNASRIPSISLCNCTLLSPWWAPWSVGVCSIAVPVRLKEGSSCMSSSTLALALALSLSFLWRVVRSSVDSDERSRFRPLGRPFMWDGDGGLKPVKSMVGGARGKVAGAWSWSSVGSSWSPVAALFWRPFLGCGGLCSRCTGSERATDGTSGGEVVCSVVGLTFASVDVSPIAGATLFLLLMVDFFIAVGRCDPCSLWYRPQALQMGCPASSRLHSGVTVVPQFWHAINNDVPG
jgi:hypothetical protein